MSAKWPSSVATDADLYVAVNSLQTTLSTSLGTGDVSVVLASATGFPAAGGVTIDNEVIFYTGVSGATLTGCTRGADGTTAASHSVGVPVGASIIAFHHNGLMAEIEAIESYLDTVLGKGTSVTATEFGYVHGVTSAIQTQFGLKAPLASPTFTGTVTLPNAAITDTSNQLVLGATRTVTVTAPTPATSSRTWTIPDIVGNGTFAALEGTQTFSGAKTFSASATFDTNSLFVDATNHLVGVGTVNPKKKLAIVDASSSSTSVGSNPVLWIGGGNAAVNTLAEIGFTYGFTGAYSETYAPVTIGYQLTSSSGFTKGDLVFATRSVTTDTQPTERMRISSGGVTLQGTTTNDNAGTGKVGEYIFSTIARGAAVSSTGSNQYFDVTNITLTAGDWDISGVLGVVLNGAVMTDNDMGISSTSGNSSAGITTGDNGSDGPPSTAAYDTIMAIPSWRVSIASSTTYYLKGFATYSAGTPKAYGRISARRAR